MFEIEYEGYDQLRIALEKMLQKLSSIYSINLNGKSFKTKFFLGGDLKFLSIVLGIKSAKSNHPCPWCHFDKSVPCDLKKNWKISRDHEQAKSYIAGGHFGYKRKALIDFLSFEYCIIDILHLLLRITDQLFKALINRINVLDGNSQSIKWDDRPYLKKLKDLLTNKCKITKPLRVKPEREEKEKPPSIKLRSLNGNERMKILNFFAGENNLFEEYFDFDLSKEQLVWGEFLRMFNEITSYSKINKPTVSNIETLKRDLKKWQSMYLNLRENKCTAYVHAFVNHVPEFLEMYGDVNVFNLQGLEKFNDFTTIYYHHSTNKQRKNFRYLIQLLKKRNRIEFFNSGGNISEILPIIRGN